MNSESDDIYNQRLSGSGAPDYSRLALVAELPSFSYQGQGFGFIHGRCYWADLSTGQIRHITADSGSCLAMADDLASAMHDQGIEGCWPSAAVFDEFKSNLVAALILAAGLVVARLEHLLKKIKQLQRELPYYAVGHHQGAGTQAEKDENIRAVNALIDSYQCMLDHWRRLAKDTAASTKEAIDIFLIAQSISQSTRGKIGMDILELIQGGERDSIEFKETLCGDTRSRSKDRASERGVMKTIAAFNNKEGGTLIMGVSDDGTVKGLDNDFNTLGKANKDGFQLHLRELIKSNFGEAFATENIKISFPEADEISICRVDIEKGRKPLFLEVIDKNGKKEKKFYVRSGNSSPDMPIDEASYYICNRFYKPSQNS